MTYLPRPIPPRPQVSRLDSNARVYLSIERDFLGFDRNNDPEKAPSKKKQRSALADLSKACSEYVQQKMLLDLRENITAKLGTAVGWRVVIDDEDPDGQTLFFE